MRIMQHHSQLQGLQRWLLAAVTDPAAPNNADQVLTGSQAQSASQRLGIYRSAYLARLLEVLREQLPCTRFAVGDELFDQFAIGYLRAFPPHSYTLGHLADSIVDHLNQT